MAVFNCSSSEIEEIIEFNVETQTGDIDTGELAVTDSLKIKGVQGVSVAVEDDTLSFGIDPETFPEELMGGDTAELEKTVKQHGTQINNIVLDQQQQSGKVAKNTQYIDTMQQTVIQHSEKITQLMADSLDNSNDIEKIELRVSEIEKSDGDPVGTVSWNNIPDKPFFDDRSMIDWDGNTEGKVNVSVFAAGFGTLVYTKISNLTPEPNELIGGAAVSSSGNTITIKESQIQDMRENGTNVVLIELGLYGTVVYEDGATLDGLTFPEKGYYLINMGGEYITHISYGSLEKLDPKYLPEGGVGYEEVESIGDTLTWDGTPTDTVVETSVGTKYYRVSDSTPTLSDLVGGYVAFPFIYEGEITAEIINEIPVGGVLVVGDYAVIVANKDEALMPIEDQIAIFPKKGVYFCYFNEDGTEVYTTQLKANGYNFTKSVTHKIDRKYIPKTEIPDTNVPTGGKYVMRDTAGDLVAIDPIDLRYPRKIFSYTHTTNKEVHVTDVDLATGVFTSPAHGISNSQTVFVSVHYPYNIGTPLAYLPTGLILGSTGNTSTSQMYYVNKIDADHFAVRTTSTGEDVTFTENPTMDLSKFHFEFLGRTDLNIEGLDLRECLLVFKGKIRNNIRWVRPTNTILFGDDGNRVGAVAYDGAFGTDMYGSCYFGRPGYNHCYATAEFRMIDQNEVYQVIESSYVMYSETGTPTLKHNRQFFHLMLEGDKIDGITMYGDLMGGFFNGSTVEVYAK